MRFDQHRPTANPVDEMRTTLHLSTGQAVFQKLSPLDWAQQADLHTWFGMKQVLEEALFGVSRNGDPKEMGVYIEFFNSEGNFFKTVCYY